MSPSCTSKFVGVNEFSLHAMYRNRLVRAYLGASRGDARTPDTFIGLDPDDDVELSATATPGRPRRLFHVVNVALNLVSGDELAWQERKATSMTATSLHVGSHGLGYRSAITYGGEPRPISLGTASGSKSSSRSPSSIAYEDTFSLHGSVGRQSGWGASQCHRPGVNSRTPRCY